jgi:hypothetical protein
LGIVIPSTLACQLHFLPEAEQPSLSLPYIHLRYSWCSAAHSTLAVSNLAQRITPRQTQRCVTSQLSGQQKGRCISHRLTTGKNLDFTVSDLSFSDSQVIDAVFSSPRDRPLLVSPFCLYSARPGFFRSQPRASTATRIPRSIYVSPRINKSEFTIREEPTSTVFT